MSLLGLVLGALGGAALGIGAGLAWVEIFKTTNFEGYSGMLVFFTFMPLGAAIGGLGGALLFGVMAFRDAEIAIEREPRAAARSAESASRSAFVQCKICGLHFGQMPLFEASTMKCSIQARRRQ